MLLRDRTAFVTGGGSGVCRAVASRILGQYTQVAIADLPTSRGGDIAPELSVGERFVPVDITAEENVRATLKAVQNSFLNGSVNCLTRSNRLR